MITGIFNPLALKNGITKVANFDARVWEVLDQDVAINYLEWRWKDCIKNSISMLASCHFSHKRLHHVKTEDRLQMLIDKGISWQDTNPAFRYDQFFLKKRIILHADENETLPEKHQFKYSDQGYERHIIKNIVIEKEEHFKTILLNILK